MTTTVRVITSDHAVAVLAFPLVDGEPVGGEQYSQLGVVQPHSQDDFYAHDGADILVRELQSDAADDVAISNAAEADPESEAA